MNLDLSVLRKYTSGITKDCIKGIRFYQLPEFEGFLPFGLQNKWQVPLVRCRNTDRLNKLEYLLLINGWFCWVHEVFHKTAAEMGGKENRAFEEMLMFGGDKKLTIAKHL